MPDFIQVETHAGEPLQAGGNTIVPYAQSIRLQIPGLQGGFTWNRPVSVLARSAEGAERILPVIDITRLVLWMLTGACIGAAIITLFVAQRQAKANRKSKQTQAQGA